MKIYYGRKEMRIIRILVMTGLATAFMNLGGCTSDNTLQDDSNISQPMKTTDKNTNSDTNRRDAMPIEQRFSEQSTVAEVTGDPSK